MGLFGRAKRTVEEPVIDLRDQEEPEPEAPTLVWGMPSRCPECGEPGYLDRNNPMKRVMEQHCPTCFAKWTVAEAECTA